jgi:hypothetical protein
LDIGVDTTTHGGYTGNATGLLDTTQGLFNAELSTLKIGGTSNRGTGTGEFIVGNGVQLSSETTYIGTGSGASGTLSILNDFASSFTSSTINFGNGLINFGNNTLTIGDTGNVTTATFNWEGGTVTGDTIEFDSTTGVFDWSAGTLAVDTFNGDLVQLGGTLAPGYETGITAVNGDYTLNSAGTIQIDLNGAASAGTDYDQLQVNGTLNLNADIGTGGTLSVLMNFTPTIGDAFTIIDNDASDLVIGTFSGLADNAEFDLINGDNTVTLRIDYDGGNGNDVVLTATNVTTTTSLSTMALHDKAFEAVFLTGVEDDEPLLFDQTSHNEANSVWNSASTSDLMLISSITEKSDSTDNLVDTADRVDLDVVQDSDSPLIGLPSDSLSYNDGTV